MSIVILEQNVMVLQNTVARASITVQDAAGVAVDPVELHLDMMDLGGTKKIEDTWPSPATRIVRTAVGKFYIDIGNQVENSETDTPREWVLDWRIQMAVGGSYTHSLQKVKVISIKTASLLPELRLLIDKSKKLVNVIDGCFLGYSDSQLLSYLEGGLTNINAYQPSLTFTFEDFPFEYRQILIDASLITGVMSQELFAVDTDIPNYNDNGVSFVISHQQQLSGFLNALVGRLDRLIPQMKLQLIRSGALHVQMGPNFRLNTLVQTGPSGAAFRGVTFKW
jgi:hypothetical protein